MATISFEEIQKLLASRDDRDDVSFTEIRFDKPQRQATAHDEEMKNKVITAECVYGTVTILFDERGLLKSIEVV